MILYNETLKRFEGNKGSDATAIWAPLGGAQVFDLAHWPPSSAVDGDFAVLQLASGEHWQFYRNSVISGTYPWQYVGGARLMADDITSTTTSSTTYTGGSPSIAIPRAGVYDIEHGALIGAGSSSTIVYLSYLLPGASSVSDDDAIIHSGVQASPTFSLARAHRKTLTSAGTLGLYYRVNPFGGTFSNRYLATTPVRIA